MLWVSMLRVIHVDFTVHSLPVQKPQCQVWWATKASTSGSSHGLSAFRWAGREAGVHSMKKTHESSKHHHVWMIENKGGQGTGGSGRHHKLTHGGIQSSGIRARYASATLLAVSRNGFMPVSLQASSIDTKKWWQEMCVNLCQGAESDDGCSSAPAHTCMP